MVGHAESGCDCFLSRIGLYDSWSSNSLILHYLTWNVFRSCRRLLDMQRLLQLEAQCITANPQFRPAHPPETIGLRLMPSELAAEIVVEHPEIVIDVSIDAGMASWFESEQAELRFVETMIEWYLIFELYHIIL